jgi:hypothetical protein
MIKKNILIGIYGFALGFFLSFFISPIRAYYYEYTNLSLIDSIEKEYLSSTLKIRQKYTLYSDIGTSKLINEGGSGFVFMKEDSRYYALTANHVIEALVGADTFEIIVQGYQDDDFDMNDVGSQVDYYNRFSKAKVEYTDPTYDLAIISFEYSKNLKLLEFANDNPNFFDKQLLLSNPVSERNSITIGRVSSLSLNKFDSEGSNELIFDVYNLTAKSEEGSSGGPILNKDYQVVGVLIGGGENIIGQFKYAKALPVESINQFINDWRNQ